MRDLDYKIISQNNVTIITFSGKITKESKEQLITCRELLTTEKSSTVILYFKDITTFEPCTFREFTLLQQEIRKNTVDLFVAGLDSKTKEYLLDRAVIRLSEIKKSLSDVFETMKKVA